MDREGAPFRLVFESDLTNEPAVRERVDKVSQDCAEAIAEVISEDTALPRGGGPPARRRPDRHGPGHRPVLARPGLAIPRDEAARLVAASCPGAASAASPRPTHPVDDTGALAGERFCARRGLACITSRLLHRAGRAPLSEEATPVEVKIGVQNVAREITLESDQTAEEVAKLVTAALADGGTLSLVDDKGRLVIVPVAVLGYVDIGAPARAASASAPSETFARPGLRVRPRY